MKDAHRIEKGFFAFALVNSTLGSNSLLMPLFTTIALGGTVRDVGLVAGAASLAGVPASIFWGNLSDRWRRRKYFLIFGFSGVAISLSLMSFAQNIPQLILLSVLMNLMWMAAAAVSTLIVIEGANKKRWESRIGSFNRFAGLGWLTGLVLGSLWMRFINGLFPPPWGLRYFFLALAAMAALGVFTAVSWIKESERKFGHRRFFGLALVIGGLMLERFRYAPFRLYHIAKPRNLYELLTNRGQFGDLTLYFYSSLLFFTGFFVFFVPFPIFLKDVLHLSGSVIYALYIVHSGTSALLQARAGKLAESFGSQRLQRVFLAVRVVIFPAIFTSSFLVGSHWAPVVIALFFLFTGASWAFVSVTGLSIVSKLADEELRGQAIGTYHAVIGIAGIIGASIGGYLASSSYLIAFITASALVLAGMLIGARIKPFT